LYNGGVVDLNEMAVFVRVVRERSFTRAARSLGLPKSTVSHRVARLEARLGVPLLHRTTRSVRCTDAGLEYYARCARIVGEAEEADAQASERHGSLRGRVRLAATQLFAQAFLPGVVSAYLRAHPETELEVLVRDGPVDLVEEGIDLAVRVGAAGGGNLVSRRLGSAPHVLCASPAFARRHGLPRAPGELPAFEFVRYGGLEAIPEALPFERGGTTVRIRPRGRLTVGSVLLARAAALDGLGIASLPEFTCVDELRAGRLVRVLPDWATLRVLIRAVYPGRHLPGRVRALLDLMVARFAPAPPWLAPPERRGGGAARTPSG
jgi:DNA-binding transcriptional LysR family regulator